MDERGYARIELPLNKGETEKLLYLEGDYINVLTISGIGSCIVKMNHRHSPEINLREVSKITGTFDKLFLTTDGGGGTCTMFIGRGPLVDISPDAAKLWAGGLASNKITTSLTVVQWFSYSWFRLTEISIVNTSGFYACYIGPWHSDAAYFKSKAYALMPHETLHFPVGEMSSFGCISYDGVHNVDIGIIGLVE